jgi:FkbM family methyltransferase
MGTSRLRQLGMLAGVVGAWPGIKRELRRHHNQKRHRFPLRFDGVSVDFATDDFYSNQWFYEQVTGHGGVYEPAAVRVLLQRLPHHKCFADVGANLGYFTVIAAKVLAPKPVYAFEMDATLAPVVLKNLEVNALSNVTHVSSPVGDDASVVEYTPHPFSFLAKVSGISTSPFSVKMSAAAVRLDDYFAGKPDIPDFIKMDVDGAEMMALRGMERLLAPADTEMLLEIHRHHLPRFGSSANEVVRHLWDRGFKLYGFEHFRDHADGPFSLVSSDDELHSPSGDMVLVTRRDVAGP